MVRRSTGLLLLLFLVLCAPAAHAQQPTAIGFWRTIDDATGEARSIVEIYEGEDGLLYGRITRILKPRADAPRNAEGKIICTVCEGERKDQPVVGMVIIEAMEPGSEGAWTGGRILDPESGKTYKSKMQLNGTDALEVRGYIGIPLFGRSQTWERVSEEATES